MKSLKVLLIVSFLLVHFNSEGQTNWKKYFIYGSAMFASGMIDGTIESISYHYENGFKRRCPNVNDQFWNPAVSWKNKYKGGNPESGPKFTGSTTAFAFTTDAYHLLRTSKRTINGLTIAYYANETYREKVTAKKKWKSVVKDFAILTAIRCAGFHLTYSLLFKRQNYLPGNP
ncbi:MAG: hypothetical protein ACXVNO_11205 [Bacteroidia bacterium]